MCSLRGDCSWAILHGTSITPIALLRLLRFFRIMWILKHVKLMRIATLLGGLAVSAAPGDAAVTLDTPEDDSRWASTGCRAQSWTVPQQ